MNAKISFFVLMTLTFCLPLNAQECPGGGTVTVNVPTPDTRSSGTSFTNNAYGYGGDIMNYSDISKFNVAAKTLAENNFSDIDGSPFLSDDFVEGVLVTNEGDVIVDIPMKINLYTKQVIAESHIGTLILLDERQYQEIIIPYEGQDLVFKRANSEKPQEFYEVLFESADLTFIKEHYVTVKEGTSNGIASRNKEFSHRTRYYVVQENGLAVKTRLKKKSLLALLPAALAKEMEAYASNNNIKFSDESDLVKLMIGISDEQAWAAKQD